MTGLAIRISGDWTQIESPEPEVGRIDRRGRGQLGLSIFEWAFRLYQKSLITQIYPDYGWGVSHLYMDWSPGHETHTNWNAHPSYQSWIFFSTSQAHCKAPGTRNVLVCLAIFSCWLILPLFGMKPDSFFWSMGKPDHALFKAMALFSTEGAKSIEKLYGKVGVWVGSWFPSFHGFLSHTFTKHPGGE